MTTTNPHLPAPSKSRLPALIDPPQPVGMPTAVRLYGGLFVTGGSIAAALALVIAGLSILSAMHVNNPQLSALPAPRQSPRLTIQVETPETPSRPLVSDSSSSVVLGPAKALIGSITSQDGSPVLGRAIEVRGQCTTIDSDESVWLAVRPVGPAGTAAGIYPVADLTSCRETQGLVAISCTGEDSHVGQHIDIEAGEPGWTARHCLGGPDSVGMSFDLQLLTGPSAAFAEIADHFVHGSSTEPVTSALAPDVELVQEIRVTRDA